MQETIEPDFAGQIHRYYRELHVHCYRMLASFEEAEDAVQETFLRAWRARDSFDGAGSLRAWLYRIATNVCTDLLRSRQRRIPAGQSLADISWLQPYPDRLLDEIIPAARDEEPEDIAIRRETISLAFLAALQALPPRQRAALVARDVLGQPAAETAKMLETSVASVNSALQRARATMKQRLPSDRADWSVTEPTAAELELTARFIEAHERMDIDSAVALAAKDLRVTMPPYALRFDGRESIAELMERAASMGAWRLMPVSANRMPAAASYLLTAGDTLFRAYKADIIRVQDGSIAEITTFGPGLFAAFGLPETLAPS
jgi:RNA polymerase sigma-70 factor (TIGR02960 family)